MAMSDKQTKKTWRIFYKLGEKGVRGRKPYKPTENKFSALAFSVLRVAINDCRAGDVGSIEWICSPHTAPWLKLAGIKRQEFIDMVNDATRFRYKDLIDFMTGKERTGSNYDE